MANPLVGVVMGSDSDLPSVQKALEVLRAFGIEYEVRVCSAHRTPDRAHEFATTAAERGMRCIIAAAGVAAHLGGVMASLTPLPVIGIPMAAGPLQGLDALLATVQMPPGIPVGTMAIGDAGATNAGVFAAQIIGAGDPAMQQKVLDYKKKLAEKVAQKDAAVQEKLA